MSWPKFKREVEDRAARFQRSLNELLVAAVPGPTEYHQAGESTGAEQRLRAEPALASGNMYAASVAGNSETVRRILEERPELASTAGGPNNWVPLLYVCFSRLLRCHPEASDRFVATAKVLLTHGADANCAFDSNGERESALYGAAGVVKCAPITRLLLECGADPNDDEATYHAAEEPGVACLNAMVEYGHDLNATGTALLRKLDFDDVAGVTRLLDLGADPDAGMRHWGKTALHQAIVRGRSLETIRLLMAAGADLNALSRGGKTPYALAVELGRDDVTAELIAAGARVTNGCVRFE